MKTYATIIIHNKNFKSTVCKTHTDIHMHSIITVTQGCQIMHNTCTAKCFTQWKWFNAICIISFTPSSPLACPHLPLHYSTPEYWEFNEGGVGLLVSVCVCFMNYRVCVCQFFPCVCLCEYLFVISPLNRKSD